MPKISGATRHSLARLLEQERHAVIDGLFQRFDVEPFSHDLTINRLKKTNYLIEELSKRTSGPSTLMSLINYVGSDSAGMPSLRRGSVASKDFYDSLDRDLAEEAKPSSSKVEAARVPTSATTPSDTRQPATASARSTDSALSGPQPTGASANQSPSTGNPNLSFDNLARRSVFIVRGRDADVHASLASFLKALDLRVITWEAAAQLAGGGSPQTLDIVRAGIAAADAVVVLLTPDDEGRVKAEFSEVTDDPREASLTGQARQNVVFEAGWALATKPNSVILVKIGDVRQLSDIHGLNYVSLTNDISSRRTLIGRLRSSGLAVDAENDDWRSAGSFPEG